MKQYLMWINGTETAGINDHWMITNNPSNGEQIGQFPIGDQEDVQKAYDTGKKGQKEWLGLSPIERSKKLRKFANVIRGHVEEIAYLDALDSGNPIDAMRNDVQIGANYLDYYAGLIIELKGETIPASNEGFHYTVQEPYGVVGRILPYNHPAMFACEKIAPPLAAGNAVILKPADQTPLSALLIANLSSGIFPPGLLNVVTGSGIITGSAITNHPSIERIAFTGNVKTGQKIMADTAPFMKNVSMELGGKNPFIVFQDADIEEAVDNAIDGMNFHIAAGQSCGSNSRILLHKSCYEQFAKLFIEKVKSIRLGLAIDSDTDMGPVISKEHMEQVNGYIEEAYNNDHGKLLFGGTNFPDHVPSHGYYINPTVFGEVNPESPIAREEIFGPVTCLFSWTSYDQMINLANDVKFGLAANIWTNDMKTARKITQDIQAGYVWINGDGRHFLGTPFGGYKLSGQGREESISELYSYTQTKTVHQF